MKIKIRTIEKHKKVISLCLLRLCLLRVLWCSVCFCTGHFVMVPINLTFPHCLQHFFLWTSPPFILRFLLLLTKMVYMKKKLYHIVYVILSRLTRDYSLYFDILSRSCLLYFHDMLFYQSQIDECNILVTVE